MAKKTLPTGKTTFLEASRLFLSATTPAPIDWGLSTAQVTVLHAAQIDLEASVVTEANAKAAYHAAVQAREARQSAHEASIRAATHIVNGTATVTNAMRATAGLPPHNPARSPIGAPMSYPNLVVEAGPNHALVYHYADVNTPHSAAKPSGVHACEIWVHTGDPQPADPSGYAFLRALSRSRYTDARPAADAGKTFYVMGRWVTAKGLTGPWSQVVVTRVPV